MTVRSAARTHLRHTVPWQYTLVLVPHITSRSMDMEFFRTLTNSNTTNIFDCNQHILSSRQFHFQPCQVIFRLKHKKRLYNLACIYFMQIRIALRPQH